MVRPKENPFPANLPLFKPQPCVNEFTVSGNINGSGWVLYQVFLHYGKQSGVKLAVILQCAVVSADHERHHIRSTNMHSEDAANDFDTINLYCVSNKIPIVLRSVSERVCEL